MLGDAEFHHLGVAVRNRAPALSLLSALGYAHGESVLDPLQNVRLTFCSHPTQPAIELIEPGEGAGPLDKILRDGDGIAYHVCYSVKSSATVLQELEAAGQRVMTVSPVKPAVLFPGSAVSFYFIIGFGLVELVEPLTIEQPQRD
jgi:Glyoxalase/Bleomycin resistance protein/Dioxygenase superfamily